MSEREGGGRERAREKREEAREGERDVETH